MPLRSKLYKPSFIHLYDLVIFNRFYLDKKCDIVSDQFFLQFREYLSEKDAMKSGPVIYVHKSRILFLFCLFF